MNLRYHLTLIIKEKLVVETCAPFGVKISTGSFQYNCNHSSYQACFARKAPTNYARTIIFNVVGASHHATFFLVCVCKLSRPQVQLDNFAAAPAHIFVGVAASADSHTLAIGNGNILSSVQVHTDWFSLVHLPHTLTGSIAQHAPSSMNSTHTHTHTHTHAHNNLHVLTGPFTLHRRYRSRHHFHT